MLSQLLWAYIDLILTNKPKSFTITNLVETGFSDFHEMTLAVTKVHFAKQQSKVIIVHCGCKNC